MLLHDLILGVALRAGKLGTRRTMQCQRDGWGSWNGMAEGDFTVRDSHCSHPVRDLLVEGPLRDTVATSTHRRRRQDYGSTTEGLVQCCTSTSSCEIKVVLSDLE